MPTRIDRAEALRRIGRPDGECTPCRVANAHAPLAASEHAVATLTPYPVRWGHGMVTIRRHVVRLSELTPAEWAEATELARQLGCALEAALRPARVYVAALGTDLDSLPMSFPHLHLHVLPVPESGARPREVLTWANGVYTGTPGEWDALREALRSAWPSSPPLDTSDLP